MKQEKIYLLAGALDVFNCKSLEDIKPTVFPSEPVYRYIVDEEGYYDSDILSTKKLNKEELEEIQNLFNCGGSLEDIEEYIEDVKFDLIKNISLKEENKEGLIVSFTIEDIEYKVEYLDYIV
jgi:hypothetical protein